MSGFVTTTWMDRLRKLGTRGLIVAVVVVIFLAVWMLQ